MNKFPIVDTIALYSRYRKNEKSVWEENHARHLKRVQSCHSRIDGGVRQSYYSIETTKGEIINLVYNEEELTWALSPSEFFPDHVLGRVLVRVHRHKHTHSRAHRIVPHRVEILSAGERQSGPATGLPYTYRLQPYRFQSGKIPSSQVTEIVTRHLENVMDTKHLHYVVKADQERLFHLVYIMDQGGWRLLKEVDEEFFFVK